MSKNPPTLQIQFENNHVIISCKQEHVSLNSELVDICKNTLLSCKGPKPTQMPESITLDFSRNFLTSISIKDCIKALSSNVNLIETLFLKENWVNHISVLCVSSNELVEFPELPDFPLEGVKGFFVNHNKITSFPKEIGWLTEKCPSLRILDLRSNAINDCSIVRAATGDINKTIESLSLSNNNISSISLLPCLPHLKFLGLFSNNIQDDTSDLIRDLSFKFPLVEDLTLGDNLKSYSTSDLCMALKQLKWFDGQSIKLI